MAEILVVRHGQASFGADNYDQLSDLGRRQGQLLGETLRAMGWHPDRAITGSLARQQQTLEEMGFSLEPEEHAGWNEYDFHDLLHQRYGGKAPDEVITDRKSHFRALRETLAEWQQGGVTGASESWKDFTARVEDARQHAADTAAERVLVVSSGGVIARLVAATLQVPDAQMITLNLQVKNTSLTRFISSKERFFLHEFNAVPHFHDAKRAELMSYS
ncbi:histidine phosphatase family protein [Phaeobacter sp. QD34_3]|uniref:histidine phosphatase family protein n=1 Tax=unclassified Phaeobacter TaxID=2621772 RepID=UPI00237F7B6B|nr:MULTISPECIES: histidine phosphatase family protein [unclassified Phaeobacter]MDE4132242.1 histidine phosphatase family protein [Phaeobacter sp. QD34_3]MDE4135880.1 histidine phosphatase family protein [Phaeobacter sp. QD34_24]MDE4175054.1 histidine phosphatase family protein [Phaeobacter sp. PT47_59]